MTVFDQHLALFIAIVNRITNNQNRITKAFLFAVLLLAACKPEDERLDKSPGAALRFDQDTILFDTVFTTQRTATRRLKVYNPNAGAVQLESVVMGGVASPYRLIVNGQAAPAAGLELLGKDSAWVLIEATLPPSGQTQPLIREDSVLFKVRGRPERQAVQVRAFGQDAVYFNGDSLTEDLTLTAGRPYVIYNGILVPSRITLTVEAGARIYLFRDANIIVEGTLDVRGTCERPVLFSGTRQEAQYATVPGQWGGIYLIGTQNEHNIRHAIIQNGFRGIQLSIPEFYRGPPVRLSLSDTRILNMADKGIWAFHGQINAYNVLVADFGDFGIFGSIGGMYNFIHCTVAQSGNNPFNRRNPAVAFTDFYEQRDSGKVYTGRLALALNSNIITGPEDEELVIAFVDGGPGGDTANIYNNLITARRTRWPASKGNRRVASQPSFYKPFRYDFHPDSLDVSHPAKRGARAFAQLPTGGIDVEKLRQDIVCRPRFADTATIGAFQQFID